MKTKNNNSAPKGPPQTDQEREARRILDHMNAEAAPGGLAANRSVFQKAGDHFSAKEAANEDAAEIWGRRIGRGFGLILFFVLLLYLFNFIFGTA